MVWIVDWTKQEATEGGGRAEGHEGRAPNRHDSPQLRSFTGIHSHDVPSVRTCKRHRTRQGTHQNHHHCRRRRSIYQPHHLVGKSACSSFPTSFGGLLKLISQLILNHMEARKAIYMFISVGGVVIYKLIGHRLLKFYLSTYFRYFKVP